MTMVMLDYMCVQSFIRSALKVIYVYIIITRGWLLLVTSMLCCHDNGNVGLHVCAKFHDRTYAVFYAHSKGIR